jgi:hypothetical protein
MMDSHAKLRAISLGSALSISLFSSAAFALPSADPSNVLVDACTKHKGEKISRLDLMHAFLRQNGISSTNFVEKEASAELQAKVQDQYSQAMQDQSTKLAQWKPQIDMGKIVNQEIYKKLNDISNQASHPADDQNRLKTGLQYIVQYIRAGNGVEVAEGGQQDFALFGASAENKQLLCKVGVEPGEDIITTLEEASPPPQFAIRGTAEELWLGGQAGRKASSFKLGYDRTKATLDDGSKKTESSVTVNGAVGYRLSAATSNSHAYLYSGYVLEKKRTKPAPALAPGAAKSDGDVNILTVGLVGSGELTKNTSSFKLYMDANVATLFDFANDARRILVKSSINPAFDEDLGICRFGGLKSLSEGSGLKTKCDIRFELEGARVLKRGTTALGNYDNFLAAGFNASYELFLPTSDGNDESGFFGAIRYRLLPVIHGPQSNIERFEAELKHRFWSDIGFGIDVGFLYAKGDAALTYEPEDSLKFSVGVVY